MKKLIAILLVIIFALSTFSGAFAIEEKTLIHSYTWREVVAYDGYTEGQIVEEVLILTNLSCFQQLVWLIGEDTADKIDLMLTFYSDGDIAVRATGDGVHYWADQNHFTWMHSSVDNKIHILLSDFLINRIIEFANTVE